MLKKSFNRNFFNYMSKGVTKNLKQISDFNTDTKEAIYRVVS